MSHANESKSRIHIQRREVGYGSLHFELVDTVHTATLPWDYHILDE